MLRANDIPLQQHTPGVGTNLHDHPAWCFEYDATSARDSLASQLGYTGRLKVGVEWLLRKQGLGVSNHFEVGAFLCLLAGETVPDVQLEGIAMRGDFRPAELSLSPVTNALPAYSVLPVVGHYGSIALTQPQHLNSDSIT